MIRNLKALALALVAVFALSAVVVSAASAQVGTLTSTGPVTLDAKSTPGAPAGSNATTATFPKQGVTKDECPNALYTGHKSLTLKQTEEGKKHELIPNDSSTFTVTPHYGLCTFTTPAGSFPMTIDMNGCDYTYHLGETTGGADTYGVTYTIVCPAGKHIVITIFSTAAKHTSGETFCQITLTEKATDYTGLDATDLTTGDVRLSGTVEGVEFDKKGGVLCPEETIANVKLDVDLTVTGTNTVGAATNIGISHL